MKYIIITITILFTLNFFAQNKGIIYNKAIHFHLQEKNDTIDFIVVDTLLDKKKPIFLFCQGSLPHPLFFEIKNKVFMYGGGISNFDIDTIKEHYHLIVISKPNTPIYADKKHLDNNYCYIPNPSNKNEYSEEYLKNDYVENYVNRANRVLKYLLKQKWVDKSKIVIAGHSQGSIIATSLAYKNKKITHLGIFGYNPNGRIEEKIRQERKFAEKGIKSWEDANKEMDYWINLWKKLNNPEFMFENQELIAWKSFSKPTINKLIAIKIPIYLAYGTEDIRTDLCDLIPLKFIEKGKNNLTLVRKIGMEHNFFEVDKNGKIDYDKAHWKETMNGFVKWTLEN